MIAVIVSQKDPAGMNIKEHLLKKGFEKTGNFFQNSEVHKKNNLCIYTIESDTVHAEGLDKDIKAELFIFATRHKAVSGRPSLSCHVPGNWSNAEHGGSSSQLCIAPALMLKKAFLALKKFGKGINYEITLEATHHGPLLNKPCMFIEIGSDEKEWVKHEPAGIIADTILSITSSTGLEGQKIAVGIGGPHYCSSFNKTLERAGIAIGHICPKHMLYHLDEPLLQQAIEKTAEKVDFVLLDWKGLGKNKQKVNKLIEKSGMEYKRTDQL